jgi:hypothetical protein
MRAKRAFTYAKRARIDTKARRTRDPPPYNPGFAA